MKVRPISVRVRLTKGIYAILTQITHSKFLVDFLPILHFLTEERYIELLGTNIPIPLVINHTYLVT